MSAAALAVRGEGSGPRPVNLRTDLGAIADLVEMCFAGQMDAEGRAAVREMRWLSHTGPLLWLLAGLNHVARGVSTGLVWVEDERLVGNVSVYRAEVREPAWVIANVAVHPDYRRRGIARSLVRASLDLLRRRRACWAILQVGHDNAAAIALYREVGFYPLRTWVIWRRSAYLSAPAGRSLPVEAARGSEWHALYDLARQSCPSGLGWMRPAAPHAFRPSLWRALGDLLGGRHEERYVVRDSSGKVTAALFIEMTLGKPADRLILMVHPAQRGRLERHLLEFALRRLGRRRKAVVIEYPCDEEAGSAALAALQFEPRRTLTHMRHDLGLVSKEGL
jgi:ribosomal protein S18 acetylase RimI-like enzyme